MTEKLLRDSLVEAQSKDEIGLFIWANWSVWDDLAYEMKKGNRYYDLAILQLLKQEESTISTQLCGFNAPGIFAVPVQKMIESEEFFKHVLEMCEKGNYKGPITFIPSNEISQYC